MEKRLKLPKSIKIGYANYTIKENIDEHSEGRCHRTTHKIEITTKDTPKSEAINTLFHELFHGINYIWGVPYPSNELEEDCVKPMANGLITVFVDNPHLVDMLSEFVKEHNGKEQVRQEEEPQG